jgi:nucleoside-diphosphate-sugar epimerase
MKNCLITGGEGFVGSLLVPQLNEAGFKAFSYDAGWFNPQKPQGFEIRADIRDTGTFSSVLKDLKIDTVVHLACISNDPSAELDKELTKSINFDCFEPTVLAAKNAGVKRFIHASTSSVYGVSDAVNITENHALVPITLYNQYKAMVEPLLLKHLDNKFQGCILRPATLCGYAPRLRLDLAVNILTNHAITNREIKVFGGDQQRPMLHIQDMANLYKLLVELPEHKFPNGDIFNVSHGNWTIKDLARIVKLIVEKEFPGEEIKIKTIDTNDHRSYHIDSSKVKNQLGFFPYYNIKIAVLDICNAFKQDKVKDSMNNSMYFNVKRLKELNVK